MESRMPSRTLLALVLALALPISPALAGDRDSDDSKSGKKEKPLDLEKASFRELYAEFKKEHVRLAETFKSKDVPTDEEGRDYAYAKKVLIKMAEKGTRDACTKICEVLETKTLANPELQAHAFEAQREALSKLPKDSAGFKHMLRLAKKRSDWRRRIDIIYALRLLEDEDSEEQLLDMITEKRPEYVGLAAIRALGFRKSVKAVDKIIRVLRKHEPDVDRTYLDCRQSLTAITGYDRATSREWKELWKKLGEEKFTQKQRGKDRLFFPRKLVMTDRLALLLDTSASMRLRDPLAGAAAPAEGGTGSTVRNPGGDGKTSLPKERERLFRGKEHARGMLLTLRKKGRFNLFHFNRRAYAWLEEGQLARVADGMIDTALDYIKNYKPRGLSLVDEGFKRVFLNDKIDTIYFYSDGVPSGRKGERQPYLPLLAEIRNLNRWKGMRIFSVGFKGIDRKFMVEVARENGGTYIEVP